AVRKTETNLQILSRSFGWCRTTLGNALHYPCPKYERLIAEHLGIKSDQAATTQDGTPKSERGERVHGHYKTKCKFNPTLTLKEF
ncbi:MAG: helix-turn-helix domain-containing protein, partial [Moraxellaceae bacterium]|nr:helix-turn-helix domain-containing protein [Moraxellaceae bacterium]